MRESSSNDPTRSSPVAWTVSVTQYKHFRQGYLALTCIMEEQHRIFFSSSWGIWERWCTSEGTSTAFVPGSNLQLKYAGNLAERRDAKRSTVHRPLISINFGRFRYIVPILMNLSWSLIPCLPVSSIIRFLDRHQSQTYNASLHRSLECRPPVLFT